MHIFFLKLDIWDVNYLIKHFVHCRAGADATLKDSDGNTILHIIMTTSLPELTNNLEDILKAGIYDRITKN